MSNNSDRIVELLHLSRGSNWTIESTLELHAAVKVASDDEQRAALLRFVYGMLSTAQQIVTLQRDAAMVSEAMAERDQIGGVH